MKNLEKLLKQLNAKLQGKEVTLCELDNAITSYGIESAYEDTTPEDVLFMGNVAYWVEGEQWVNAEFEVIKINKQEMIDSIVKIKYVEEI